MKACGRRCQNRGHLYTPYMYGPINLYTPCTSIHPHTSIYPSIPPCTSVFSPYHVFPYVRGLGGIWTPYMSWDLLRASVQLSGISIFVSTFIAFHVSIMWFCCHYWHQGTLEMLLALPLYCSSNLHLRCLISLLQLYHGSSTGSFFSELSLLPFSVFICLLSVLVYAFCFQVTCWILYSPMGSQLLGSTPLQPFGAYLWYAYMQPGDGHWLKSGIHRVAAPSTALSRGSLLLLIKLSLTIPTIWWGKQLWGLGRESSDPSTFPGWWGRGLLFQFDSI